MCKDTGRSRLPLQDMLMVMYTRASEMKVPGAGKAELVFTAEDGTQTKELIHEFKGAGVSTGHAQPKRFY